MSKSKSPSFNSHHLVKPLSFGSPRIFTHKDSINSLKKISIHGSESQNLSQPTKIVGRESSEPLFEHSYLNLSHVSLSCSLPIFLSNQIEQDEIVPPSPHPKSHNEPLTCSSSSLLEMNFERSEIPTKKRLSIEIDDLGDESEGYDNDVISFDSKSLRDNNPLPSRVDVITDLPEEILYHIVLYLEPVWIATLTQTCKHFNRICEDTRIWKLFFKNKSIYSRRYRVLKISQELDIIENVDYLKLKFIYVPDINWEEISKKEKLTEDFIEVHKRKVWWGEISQYQKLSEKFLRRFKHYVDWGLVSQHQQLSEKLMEKNDYRLHFRSISRYQQLSESFIRKYKDRLDWNELCVYQKLSETLIDDFRDRVCWKSICRFQTLTEEFIEKHKSDIDWTMVTTYQKLSQDFIKNNKYKVNWKAVHMVQYRLYQTVSADFVKKEKPSLVIAVRRMAPLRGFWKTSD